LFLFSSEFSSSTTPDLLLNSNSNSRAELENLLVIFNCTYFSVAAAAAAAAVPS
jgi:hypothetical protein